MRSVLSRERKEGKGRGGKIGFSRLEKQHQLTAAPKRPLPQTTPEPLRYRNLYKSASSQREFIAKDIFFSLHKHTHSDSGLFFPSQCTQREDAFPMISSLHPPPLPLPRPPQNSSNTHIFKDTFPIRTNPRLSKASDNAQTQNQRYFAPISGAHSERTAAYPHHCYSHSHGRLLIAEISDLIMNDSLTFCFIVRIVSAGVSVFIQLFLCFRRADFGCWGAFFCFNFVRGCVLSIICFCVFGETHFSHRGRRRRRRWWCWFQMLVPWVQARPGFKTCLKLIWIAAV